MFTQDNTPKREESPYESAGLFSRLFFLYGVPLMRKGWKKPLQAEDIPPIAERDHAPRVTNLLEMAWERELEVLRASQHSKTKHTKRRGNANDPDTSEQEMLTSPSTEEEHGSTGGGLGVKTSVFTLWKAILRAHSSTVIYSAVLCVIESASVIAQPILLRYFIKWLSRDGAVVGEGVGIAFAMVICSIIQSLARHSLFFLTMRMGWNVRMGFIGMVHNKLLRLTGAPSSGKVINLVSTDVTRFDTLIPAMHFSWVGLLDVLVVTILICVQIGAPSGLAGVSVMLAILCTQLQFARLFARRRQLTAALTDLRVRTTSEVLSGMLSVKAFCWEKPFTNEINEVRKKKAFCIRKSQEMKAMNDGMYLASGTLALFVMFAVKWGMNETLEITSVLSVIALVSVMRASVGRKFTRFTEAAPEAHVAVSRLQAFLELPEHRAQDRPKCKNPNNVLEIEHADFYWTAERVESNPGTSTNTNNHNNTKKDQGQSQMEEVKALTDINLSLAKGKLLMVAGAVGSGKSALLQAILGELARKRGDLRITGTLSYHQQSPWIMAGNIRDNILFGLDYDEARYKETLFACALLTDLEQLPDGENTEIGEKGVNLSGGQKARVALARAYYGNFDIVLMDDPLSAVDPHVAEHLYEHAVLGLIRRGAAVVLVTHHPHFFRSADEIILLRHGQIVAQGSMRDLQTNHRAELEEMSLITADDAAAAHAPTSAQHSSSPQSAGASQPKAPHAPGAEITPADTTLSASSSSATETKGGEGATKDSSKQPNKLVIVEDRKVGVVEWSTYRAYIASGGTAFVIINFILFLSVQAFVINADNWLKSFAKKNAVDQDNIRNIYGYGGLTAATIIVALTTTLSFYAITRRAATNIHTMALSRVLAAPMSFFTSNPHGRILNRFSADQGQVDELLAPAIFETLQRGCTALGAIIFVCIVLPYTLIFLPFMFYYMIYVRNFATKSLRELKRLDNTSRSPIFAAFSASLNGLVSIRAFGRKEATQANFLHLLEKNAQVWFWWLIGNRWVGLRLDMICTLLTTTTAFLGVILRNTVDPGLLGLALLYITALSGDFQLMIRNSALVETYITSVERLLHYGRDIAVEKDPAQNMTLAEIESSAPSNWPQQGNLDVEHLFVRYREDLPLVMRDASFSVKGGFKVGIVGRTGSGKSSLVQALFRLNEVESGRILIDGVDTGLLPLNRLRSAIGFIPQSPHLFQGTLRYNLDPFGVYPDKDLWDALESVQLKGAVKELEMSVEEGGRNFSTGQRQLLSMARAMLGHKRVVVMDEATANVDYATDALIQHALRNAHAFRNATVLVIAHRIKTIEDSDVILVLDNGHVAEFGPPEELLKNPDSIYFALREKSLEEAREVGGK